LIQKIKKLKEVKEFYIARNVTKTEFKRRKIESKDAKKKLK